MASCEPAAEPPGLGELGQDVGEEAHLQLRGIEYPAEPLRVLAQQVRCLGHHRQQLPHLQAAVDDPATGGAPENPAA